MGDLHEFFKQDRFASSSGLNCSTPPPQKGHNRFVRVRSHRLLYTLVGKNYQRLSAAEIQQGATGDLYAPSAKMPAMRLAQPTGLQFQRRRP